MSVVVLGLGNVLTADDALGPYVIRMLEAAYDFDADVSLLDAGTPGTDLGPHIAGTRAVIVIDTVRAAGSPGDVRTYRKDTLMREPPAPRVNPHAPGLKETLFTLDVLDLAPRELLLIGVIPGAIEVGIGLTDVVLEAVPRVINEVLTELRRLGVPARPRVNAALPDLWWEAATV